MASVNTKQNCGTVTKNPPCTEVFYSKIRRYTEEFIQWLIDQTTFLLVPGSWSIEIRTEKRHIRRRAFQRVFFRGFSQRSLARGFSPRPATALSKTALGSKRRILLSTPICHGIVR